MRVAALTAVFAVIGCTNLERPLLFTPMDEAVRIVETNRQRVRTGLKASGTARGHFLDDAGSRRHFDLVAKLQVVPPSHLRFVMQNALGADEVEVGMNDEKWWLLARRPDERYYEGRMGRQTGVSIGGTVPLRAEQLTEALGLGRLSRSDVGPRVVDEYQQLVFMADGPDGPVIVKEYWLDRREPRLIGRIVFRDDQGRIVLSSALSQYRPVGDAGLQLPHEVRLHWPMDDAEMTFRIRRWEELPQLAPQHRAFVSPKDRDPDRRFQHESVTAD